MQSFNATLPVGVGCKVRKKLRLPVGFEGPPSLILTPKILHSLCQTFRLPRTTKKGHNSLVNFIPTMASIPAEEAHEPLV